MNARRLIIDVRLGWLLLVGMLLTACGGVASNEEGASGEEGGPVRIGAPFPLSGAWAENGQNNVQGMELAVDEINNNGGIEALDGAQLELYDVDTSSDDPSQAQSVTTQLIRDQQVSALVGSYLSSLTLTSSTAAEQEGVPMVTQSFVDELTNRGYSTIFQLPPKSSAFGTNTVEYYVQIAQAQGIPVQTAAVVASNDAATSAQAETVQEEAEGRGIEVGAYVTYPPGIQDPSAIISQVQGAEPDVIFAGGPVGDITLIIQGLRDRGVEAPVVGTGGTGFLVKGLAEGLGEQVDGVLSLAAWNEDMQLEGAGEVLREASEAYKQTYGEPFMPQEAGESYVAVYLIKEAIEQAQSSDPTAIRDALAQISVDSGPEAAMPPGRIAFDDTGMNQYVIPIMIQWQDQVPTTVWPEEMAAAEVRLP